MEEWMSNVSYVHSSRKNWKCKYMYMNRFTVIVLFLFCLLSLALYDRVLSNANLRDYTTYFGPNKMSGCKRTRKRWSRGEKYVNIANAE